jgi:hypothetical protein
MNRHLTPDVLVALAEGGRVEASARAHVRDCARCASEVASLAGVLGELRADEMPEPSPLFWPQLSARIRAAIDREVDQSARGGMAWPGWRWWASAATLSAGVLALLMAVAWGPSRAPLDLAGMGDDSLTSVGGEPLPNDAWALVLDVTSGIDASDAGDEVPALAPASVEGAVADLSQDERAELERLLRAELQGTAL